VPDLVATPGTLGLALPDDQAMAAMVLDFCRDLQTDFKQRDELFGNIDKALFLEQEVIIPDNYKNTAVQVRSPLPPHIANSITSALSINVPTVSFNAIEFGDVGEEAATYRARFFQASWRRQQREKRRQIYRMFMHSVVTKGIGILKTFERKNRAWAKYSDYSKDLLDQLDEAEKKRQIDPAARSQLFDAQTEQFKRGLPYPIETTEIPPETFYYQMGEDGLTRAVEIKQVPYYETLIRYGAALSPNGAVVRMDDVTSRPLPDTQWGAAFTSSPGTSIRKSLTMVEHWDWKYCTVVLRGPGDFPSAGSGMTGSGLVVKRWEHGYGDNALQVLNGPYFIAPGIVTSSREPHKAQLGVLFAYLHLFPLLNSLLTMQSQAAFSFSYPAYRRTTPPAFGIPDSPFGMDALELQGNREKIVPGAIFPHDIAPMDQPQTSVDLDKAISFTRSLIDMALPDAVQGVVTGETAGYTLNQAAHLASLQWSPIIDNVEVCLSERTGWESWLIENRIGETVYVWGSYPQPRRRPGQPVQFKDGWMGIGPKELKGVHLYEVKIDPANVNNEALKLRNIEMKLNLRLISPDMAIREAGYDPIEVERKWLLHELKSDPEIRGNLKQRIFQGLATIDQQKMQDVPPGGEPQGPQVAQSQQPNVPQGVAPGVTPEGFVPPLQPGAQPPNPAQPGNQLGPGGQPQGPPMAPGTLPGQPGGVRGAPAAHTPLPGGG
jgi:hypothetical protein